MRISTLVVLACLLATNASAAPVNNAKQTKEQRVRQTLDKIKATCGITSGQFSYDVKGISLVYDGMIEREKLDCASNLTTLVGADFDSHDTSAPYSGPRRFIVKGPAKRLDSVAQESVAAHWTTIRRADAGDGTGFLEIEVGPSVTRRQAREFLDRFLFGDFSEIAIGLAPRTLYGIEGPAVDTVFRAAARRMYGALANSSCRPASGFDRETLIKPERDAVASFERELSTQPTAATQLGIAKEDAAFGQAHCWADDDIRFAKIHVEGDQKTVTSGITRLRELAPILDPMPDYKVPLNAAEFRNQVRAMMESVDLLCRWTSRGTNEEVLAASMAEIDDFEKSLSGSPYATHFNIAKADITYDRAGLVAECDGPGSEPVSKLSSGALAEVNVKIGKLRALMQDSK